MIQIRTEQLEYNDEIRFQVEALDIFKDDIGVAVLLYGMEDFNLCFGSTDMFCYWFYNLKLKRYFHGEIFVFDEVIGFEASAECSTS